MLHRHAPGARVVDLTHGVAPHDVRAGAFTLWRAVPWLVPGVILAVVDPGAGPSRRAVALRAGPAVLVGPDNGLLLPAATRLGGPSEAVELDPAGSAAPPPAAPPVGVTDAARDLFAPAAGALAAGAALTDVGRPVDPATLTALAVPAPVADPAGRGVRAEVLWVDTFGNAQLNLTAADLDRLAPPAGAPVRLETGAADHRQAVTVRVVASYAEIGEDQFALVVDSYGLLSVSADRRPAGAALGLVAGRAVRLCREDGDRR